MQKTIKKFLICFVASLIVITILLEIPTIADFGDYDSYDGFSSYDDDWGGSSSWSDSDWGSSSTSWDDDYYSGSSGYYSGSSGSSFFDDFFLFMIIRNLGPGLILIIIIFAFFYYYRRKGRRNEVDRNFDYLRARERNNRQKNRQALFGVDDKSIEDSIQQDDPLFNKAEFLNYVSDTFIKLQYAWSDRNLEEVRYIISPELYEQTNSQVQRYIQNKQINKLERISVNMSRLYSYDKQGDRDILRVVIESKMVDYIIDENSGNVIKGNPNVDNINPYILTFARKTGIKTEEGGLKPVTMNCPNCGGATTILSSGKCPYCGSIITTRNNNWTLTELKVYRPNA